MTDQLALFEGPKGSASFSDDGAHRYRLERDHGGGRTVAFVMLNPSRAGANVDDHTVRKCLGFARRLDYRRLVVVNLFSMVATDPTELLAADYDWAAGDPRNFEEVLVACTEADLVLAAWGTHAAQVGSRQGRPRRDRLVTEALTKVGVELHCLTTTRGGHPGHPLRLSYDLRPRPWTQP
jgi:hypothetical protein